LVSQSNGSATAIACDAQNVYRSDPNAGLCTQAPLSGGLPLTLASGHDFAQARWSTRPRLPGDWTNNGVKCARADGGGTGHDLLAESFSADVAVDDTYAYWIGQ
jgi:hypothetical protein